MQSSPFSFALPYTDIKESAVRELFKYLARPDMISLAGGYPSPELFDLQGISACVSACSKDLLPHLSYGPTEGLSSLRDALSQLMKKKDVQAASDRILVTGGSQQGYNLLLRILVEPGDTVFVERPTYSAAIQGLRLAGAKIVTVGIQEDGIDIRELTGLLAEHRPKLFYTVPTFANPSGATLSLEKRKQLLNLAARHRFVLVEDDPYSDLRFDGRALPSLKSLSQQHASADLVVYLGSLSKTVAPGLRIGWMAADPAIIKRCVLAKQVDDLCSPPLLQAAMAAYISNGSYDRHLPLIVNAYKSKATAMKESIGDIFGHDFTLSPCEGGMFLWGRLPADIQAADLLPYAIKENVMFVAGSSFFADQPDLSSIRLSFAMSSEEHIRIGISRLKHAVDRFMGNT